MDLLPIVTLLVALTFTLLITRIATVALTLTGLSRESARFQARSAITGVGFTSVESEQVVTHPVRRRIISLLMLIGNAGIVTMIATLMASLVNASKQGGDWLQNLLILVAGLLVFFLISTSDWIDRQMSWAIEWAFARFTKLDVHDYVALFRLQDGYAVSEIQVDADDWLAEKTLAELRLPSEGVLVLGVHQPDHTYVGAPTAQTKIHALDTLIVYGPVLRINDLNQRREGREGRQAHLQAIQEQKKIVEEQATKPGD